jgi:hypothetical protein
VIFALFGATNPNFFYILSVKKQFQRIIPINQQNIWHLSQAMSQINIVKIFFKKHL